MTPIENVRLTAKLDAAPILERLGLTKEETQRNVLKLSGGQQRVAISRALASDAPVILADESTGNLDSETKPGTEDNSDSVSLPDGYTYSFKNPDNANGIVVIPKE